MKRCAAIVLFAAMAIIEAGIARAQDSSESAGTSSVPMGMVAKGVKLGVNLTTAHFDINNTSYTPDTKRLIRMGAGLFAVYRIKPRFGWQGELLYNQRGHEAGVDPIEGARIDYLDAIVLARFDVSSRGFALVGPVLGFRLRAEGYTSEGEAPGIRNDTKFYEVAGVLGGGITVLQQSPMVSVEARYHFGLSSISDSEAVDATLITNRVFAFLLGVAF